MQLPIAIATVLLAGILVMLVPGACLLATWRLDRVVPPPLVPAAAAALGLVPLAALTAAALLLERPIEYVAAPLALLVLVLWGRLARRARIDRHDDSFTRSRGRAGARDWLTPVGHLLAGTWLRGTPRAALAVALAGSVLALLVGFHAWNDSLYHIAQAQKLLALDSPTFDNTLQFTDGSAHPGYLLPAWHAMLALVSLVSRQDPVTAAWILPALTFPIVLLAVGGAAWVLARARAATSVAALAVLLVNVAALPYSDAITNAMQPGVFALGVLAPLVLAMVVTALWPDDGRTRLRDDLAPRVTTRAATWLAVVATAGLGMLHVSYLWVLGMGLLGYYLFWALRSPWPREVVRRHLLVGLAVAVVAATIVAALYPGLANLEGLGRDAATELAATDNAQYQGENDANLEALLRGDPTGAYHLRGDYLVQSGGLALLGLLGLLVPLLAPRWRGGWYLAGAALLPLMIAMSDRLFPALVDVVTLDQARRVERVVPASLGLATLGLAIAVAGIRLLAAPGTRRILGGVLLAGSAAALAVVVEVVPPLAGYAGERIVPPRVLVGVLLVLALAVVVQGAGLVVRLLRRRTSELADEPAPTRRLPFARLTWPTELVDARAALVAFALLLVAAVPVYDRLANVAKAERLTQVPIDMRGAELRLFSSRVADQLRELPAGSVVLADPRTRNPYVAMAIAPVYVVSSVPRHTALTPENRVDERFATAVEFFDAGTSDARRLAILRDEQVDAVLVHPAASSEAQDLLAALPGVDVVAEGKNQRLYVVDRSELRERSPAEIA